jgi:Conserved oligomeric complex COG6
MLFTCETSLVDIYGLLLHCTLLYTLSQAHDAVRYVGDMLAWVHQTAAMEKELLTALFGMPLCITYLMTLITHLCCVHARYYCSATQPAANSDLCVSALNLLHCYILSLQHQAY